MATTRATFRTRLKYRAGNRTFTDAELDAWLDAGRLDLAHRIRIRQFETVTTGTYTVSVGTLAFPTNMIAVLDIRNTTLDRHLDFIEWPRYRQLRIVSGDPRQWTVIGTTIYLDKIPTSTDALSYVGIAVPAWAGGATDVPGIDDQLEYGIELLAAAHLFRDIGDAEKAAKIENPETPGTGEYWVWVRANRLPQLHQGMANRRLPGTQIALEGYAVIE